MKSIVMVVGLLAGLIVGACDVVQFNEGAPLDDGSDVIKDNDPHLPGSCNSFACDTPNEDPHGDNPSQCTGCDCKPVPSECRACQTRCGADYLRCLGRGFSDEGCRSVFGPACDEACTGGVITCACRVH